MKERDLFYRNKTCILATMHKKEEAISLPFKEIAGLTIKVAELDTDHFGTFSGEVARKESTLLTAKKKCEHALLLTGSNIGCASEGSFGPHPLAPFLSAGIEILYFIDKEVGISFHETLVTEETNYQQSAIKTLDDLQAFANRALFPSHGLIVRPCQGPNSHCLYKGIQNYEELVKHFSTSSRLSTDQAAWVETDMRAHKNPTRMSEIQKLARKLATRLSRRCPVCHAPGWGEAEKIFGLPCEACLLPSEQILGSLWRCLKCAHEVFQENEKKYASQLYCSYCNP